MQILLVVIAIVVIVIVVDIISIIPVVIFYCLVPHFYFYLAALLNYVLLSMPLSSTILQPRTPRPRENFYSKTKGKGKGRHGLGRRVEGFILIDFEFFVRTDFHLFGPISICSDRFSFVRIDSVLRLDRFSNKPFS